MSRRATAARATCVQEQALRARASRLAEQLRAQGAQAAQLAIVLGSGLGGLASALEGARTIPFAALPDMPASAVPSHPGAFVLARLGGSPVLVQAGRVHLYEGWSPFEVTCSVRAFAELGIPRLVLTNAAGCLRPEWKVPGLMRIDDHIARVGAVGLFAGEARRGKAFAPQMGAVLDAAAAQEGILLPSGTYLGLLGPSYETPAEIAMFAALGVSAVGMSTVAEASVARALGLGVAGISCLSNLAAGLSPKPLSHAAVVRAGEITAAILLRLLTRAAPQLQER